MLDLPRHIAVLAHATGRHRPAAWWTAWNWQPLILASLFLLAFLYVLGVRRLWRRAGTGRGVSRWHAAAYAASIVALFVALVSPLDPLSDELSSIHMIQHTALMVIAAPLFILGAPARVLPWVLPRAGQRWLGRCRRRIDSWYSPWYLLWQPLLVWVVYAFTLWIWHLPVLYEAALHNSLVHDMQHLTFFAASCLFWRVLLDPLGRLRLVHGVAVMYLFTTSLHAMLLGVFMALSPRVWYPFYADRTPAWNLTPLQDQQLAGLIMWMPGCLVYAVAAAGLFAAWIGGLDRRSSRPPRTPAEHTLRLSR